MDWLITIGIIVVGFAAGYAFRSYRTTTAVEPFKSQLHDSRK